MNFVNEKYKEYENHNGYVYINHEKQDMIIEYIVSFIDPSRILYFIVYPYNNHDRNNIARICIDKPEYFGDDGYKLSKSEKIQLANILKSNYMDNMTVWDAIFDNFNYDQKVYFENKNWVDIKPTIMPNYLNL